ncbi:hypothetical protein [Anatilimnocola floriformis]|uniref:hypothetical protein n=1 Tax=Anatilimnocola floriformis TaxID=2948575 RepID=UPI0020C37FC8|nr:hypothetical protein [Anatilimnocola floriformis]
MRDDNSDVPNATGGTPKPINESAAEETEAEREARYQRAIAEALAVTENSVFSQPKVVADDAAAIAPAKFSLREMLILTTALAVVLGLLRSFDLWGGLVTFIAAIAWGNCIYPCWHPKEPRRQATMFDSIWGLLMPLICLACDPLVFRDTDLRIELGGHSLHDIQFGIAAKQWLLTASSFGRWWSSPSG